MWAGQASVWFLSIGFLLTALVALGTPNPRPVAAASADFSSDFSGWHLPLPAGEWLISRGPCGAGGLFTHQCGYYEDACALDLTPISGSMEHVPVLAPQAGQVFFLGTRSDSGLTVMIQHDDGRVSALMHLARIVVGLDQRVQPGQVVAYAGNSGSSTRPHLHFHVQPNAVERECLPLDGFAGVDLVRLTATSTNLAWHELVLPDPPSDLPPWLPLLSPSRAGFLLPERVLLAPGARVRLPVAVANDRLQGRYLAYAGAAHPPALSTPTHTVFWLPLSAPAQAGEFVRLLHLKAPEPGTLGRALRLGFAVREPAETSASERVVLISPTFIGPPNWAELSQPPRLCWSEHEAAGAPPLLFRVMLAGPQLLDSGWIAETCWQAPALVQGTYYWKVFVRDGDGYMNRTNQRPFVFRIR